MSINFSGKASGQKYLIILLIIIVLIIFFILKKDVIFKAFTPSLTAPEVFQPQNIEINFEVLKSPVVKELQLPAPEIPFEGKAGRENPFLPY